MAGVAPLPQPAALPRTANSFASELNRARIVQVAARLSEHFQSNALVDPNEFFQLCFALARGIDYAVSHGDVPPNCNDLPPVIKKAYHRRGEAYLQPAVMVLLISAKNACRNKWFLPAESDEILSMTYEISNAFCLANSMTSEERRSLQIVSNVTSRFYPRIKLSRLFASFEVKSGYEILVADIYIPRNITREERIHLFVAQTDNMETSNCIISPPQVNFIVNGKGVDKRTNVSMENGPQFPSDITKLLKYGMNIFQAIGSFHGDYIIAIAVMSLANASDAFVLQDYIKPVVPMVELDSEIIEGASRISLNCPISFKRIKTPVKGHLCKHHQCFDFDNFLEMNSRKPSWRCPHCNQSVSYIDIRKDRFMEKILKEAGEGVSEIIISASGTWEAFGEHLVNPPPVHNKPLADQYDGIPARETIEPVGNTSDVVDLTIEDYIGVGAEGPGRLEPDQGGRTSEIEGSKPLQDKLIDTSASLRTDLRSTSGPAHVAPQVSTEMHSSESSELASITHDQMWTSQPILPSSPNYGDSSSHDVLLAIPASTALDMQLQQSRFGNSIISSKTERPLIPRYVSRVPTAIQALPVQSQYQTYHKKARTSENGSGPIISSSSPLEVASPEAYDVTSQIGFTTQVIGLPAQSQGGSGAVLDRLRVTGTQRSNVLQSNQAISQLPNSLPRLAALPARQASQSPVHALAGTLRNTQDNLHPPRFGSQAGSPQNASVPPQASRVSLPIGEQMHVGAAPAQALVRSDSFSDPQSEQNWRPTGRMRGSLTGSAYSAALKHYSEQPLPSPTAPTTSASNPLSPRISNTTTGTASIINQTNVASGNPTNPS